MALEHYVDQEILRRDASDNDDGGSKIRRLVYGNGWIFAGTVMIGFGLAALSALYPGS